MLGGDPDSAQVLPQVATSVEKFRHLAKASTEFFKRRSLFALYDHPEKSRFLKYKMARSVKFEIPRKIAHDRLFSESK